MDLTRLHADYWLGYRGPHWSVQMHRKCKQEGGVMRDHWMVHAGHCSCSTLQSLDAHTDS